MQFVHFINVSKNNIIIQLRQHGLTFNTQASQIGSLPLDISQD